MTFIPDAFLSWFAVGIAIIGGVIALLGYGRKESREQVERREKIADDSAERLITTLTNQRDATERDLKSSLSRLDTMGAEHAKLMAQLEEKTKQNAEYRSIIEGRDQHTTAFQNAAIEAIKLGEKTHRIVESNTKVLESLSKNFEVFSAGFQKVLTLVPKKKGKRNKKERV